MFRSDIAFAITVEDKEQRAQIWAALVEIAKREIKKPNVYGVVLTANDEDAFAANDEQVEHRTDVGVFYPDREDALTLIRDILTMAQEHGMLDGDSVKHTHVAQSILNVLRD